MKNKIIFVASLILILVDLNVSLAVRPTYILTAQNFTFRSANELVFDIYILHTNPADISISVCHWDNTISTLTLCSAQVEVYCTILLPEIQETVQIFHLLQDQETQQNGSSLKS
ncbi:MAG: hypothetical protein IPL16_18840 [Ignavibacteria bacterium]|nr:hypothetical protein [Ignavibacteria bacterium]